jgi:hypothetical protein
MLKILADTKLTTGGGTIDQALTLRFRAVNAKTRLGHELLMKEGTAADCCLSVPICGLNKVTTRALTLSPFSPDLNDLHRSLQSPMGAAAAPLTLSAQV